MGFNAWKICSYLADQGVGLCGGIAFEREVRHDIDDTAHHLTQFLRADLLDDMTRFLVLSHSGVSLATFIDIRRSIWPDDEFYAKRFHSHRSQFVEQVLSFGASLPSLPEVVQFILSNGNELRKRFSELEGSFADDRRLLQNVSRNIASILTRIGDFPAGSAMPLRARLLESYQKLVPDILLSTQLFYDDRGVRRIPRCLCDTLVEQLRAMNNCRHLQLSKQIDLAQRAMQFWLEALEAGGVDLELYGELEQPLLDSYRKEQMTRPLTGTSLDRWYENDIRIKAELIGLQYGPKPRDWKFFWREPTDVFVGEFWRDIEREIPLLPGSWVEDEEDDNDWTGDEGEDCDVPKLWGFSKGR